MRKFCEKLKELRLENGLSFEEMSKRINISNATICRWENGLNDIKSDELIIVAKFFNVSTDYLLGMND